MSDKYEIFLDGGHHVNLGRGAFGTVYKYRVRGTDNVVAVKELDNSGVRIEKRREEIETWRRIKAHPHVVALLDSWEEAGVIRAVMPLAVGSLDRLVLSMLDTHHTLGEGSERHDSRLLLHMAVMLLQGMNHLHNSSPVILHRDLKPQNILYFQEKGRMVLKIADFGISKALEGTMNAQTHYIGTRDFQAPEVIQERFENENYSREVDVWSLGLVLYYLVMGGELPSFRHLDNWEQRDIDVSLAGDWVGKNLFKDDETVEIIKTIIKKMLVLEKDKRISVSDALIVAESYMEDNQDPSDSSAPTWQPLPSAMAEDVETVSYRDSRETQDLTLVKRLSRTFSNLELILGKSRKVLIAKDVVTLWKYNKNSKPETKTFTKGTDDAKYDSKESLEKFWRLRPKQGLSGFTGYASRFHFYPEDFVFPLQQSKEYFGELKKQDAEDLLLSNEKNGDGSYLLWTGQDGKFVLSVRCLSSQGLWEVQHSRIETSSKDDKTLQYYLQNSSCFDSLTELIDHYKRNMTTDPPTCLTKACFPPNPHTDHNIRTQLQLKQGEDWVIPREEIGETVIKVRHGHFGCLFWRHWRELEVTVKELKSFDEVNKKGEKIAKTFQREIKMMKKLNHPNLVKMYGTNNDKYPHYIIMECFEHRSLKNYLEEYKTARGKVIDKRRKPPEFSQLQEWCKDIASGMAHLEQLRIIHNDLTAGNVMLTELKRAKIGQFGLSRPEDEDEAGPSIFPLRWSAPEVVLSRKPVLKSDVWSFGVTMWEILSFADLPFGGLEIRNIKWTLGEGGAPLEEPFDYLDTRSDVTLSRALRDLYSDVMCKCWKFNPEDRPTFHSLRSQLPLDCSSQNLHLVQLFESLGTEWRSLGHGHASIVQREQEDFLVVKAREDESLLLESSIQPENQYDKDDKEQPWEIYWLENGTNSMSMTFDEKSSFENIWTGLTGTEFVMSS